MISFFGVPCFKLTEGNTSGAAKEAADAAKVNNSKGSKGKGKSSGGSGDGGTGGGEKGKRKATRSSTQTESPAEVALACFEECVCIAAHCSPRARTGSSRTAKFLAVSASLCFVLREDGVLPHVGVTCYNDRTYVCLCEEPPFLTFCGCGRSLMWLLAYGYVRQRVNFFPRMSRSLGLASTFL